MCHCAPVISESVCFVFCYHLGCKTQFSPSLSGSTPSTDSNCDWFHRLPVERWHRHQHPNPTAVGWSWVRQVDRPVHPVASTHEEESHATVREWQWKLLKVRGALSGLTGNWSPPFERGNLAWETSTRTLSNWLDGLTVLILVFSWKCKRKTPKGCTALEQKGLKCPVCLAVTTASQQQFWQLIRTGYEASTQLTWTSFSRYSLQGILQKHTSVGPAGSVLS